MIYRKVVEEIPLENTAVWTCSREGCNGWMRDNFAFDMNPACPLCSSQMYTETKMLPMLTNHNSNLKGIKKGIPIFS